MPDADPNADLALRRRQLETHLLMSHDYRDKVGARLKLLAWIEGMALLMAVGEGVAYIRQPSEARPVVLGLIGLTLLVLVASAVLLVRTWHCLDRLNERWLTPDAKKTLNALRMELARHQGAAR